MICHPAQAVGDDIVDDVEAQADTAFMAARGEESHLVSFLT
jgi:hypothetical protein